MRLLTRQELNAEYKRSYDSVHTFCPKIDCPKIDKQNLQLPNNCFNSFKGKVQVGDVVTVVFGEKENILFKNDCMIRQSVLDDPDTNPIHDELRKLKSWTYYTEEHLYKVTKVITKDRFNVEPFMLDENKIIVRHQSNRCKKTVKVPIESINPFRLCSCYYKFKYWEYSENDMESFMTRFEEFKTEILNAKDEKQIQVLKKKFIRSYLQIIHKLLLYNIWIPQTKIYFEYIESQRSILIEMFGEEVIQNLSTYEKTVKSMNKKYNDAVKNTGQFYSEELYYWHYRPSYLATSKITTDSKLKLKEISLAKINQILRPDSIFEYVKYVPKSNSYDDNIPPPEHYFGKVGNIVDVIIHQKNESQKDIRLDVRILQMMSVTRYLGIVESTDDEFVNGVIIMFDSDAIIDISNFCQGNGDKLNLSVNTLVKPTFRSEIDFEDLTDAKMLSIDEYVSKLITSLLIEKYPRINTDEECIICYDDETKASMRCISEKHYFHYECLAKHLISRNFCPLCMVPMI